MKNSNSLVFDDQGLDRLEKVCPVDQESEMYKAGMNEAKNLIKRLCEITHNRLEEHFISNNVSEILDSYTLDEIKDILSKYDEIKVGDVVIAYNNIYLCIKDNVDGNCDRCNLLASDGAVELKIEKSACKKTEKHFNIDVILKQLEEVVS